MQVIEQKFEIEEILLSEIATRAKSLHKTESALVNELLRKALQTKAVFATLQKL